MKQEFSTNWKSSKQPRKQRKYLHNLPLHLKPKIMVSTLEKVLRKKYGMRNVEIRKGDEVKIMRGKFSKKVGKVVEVNRKKGKVSLEGINNSKKDGTKVRVWFFPSKLKIIQMNEEDKRRFDLTKRTGKENA